jgi:dolichyl-diphosphooligosaccharide--protein glycosyltransferase
MRRGRTGAWALLIFGLGLAVRAIWWPRIFTAQGMMPPHSADSYYHLRRIGYSVARFPEVLEHDPYVGFPGVGEIVWPPGFDLGVAFLARLLVGGDAAGMEAVAAWVPAVLGALTAVAAAAVAARVFRPAAGCVAGVLLALLPAHYTYTQLGKVDHHAAVSLGSVLLILGCVAAVRRAGRPWPGLAVALGLGVAAFLYTWAGGLLLIGLLQALAAIWMFQAVEVDEARSRARHLAIVQGVAALAVAPYALGRSWEQYGDWSPLVLGSFQPVWLAATAGACVLFVAAWRAPALGSTPARRWLGALGLAGAGGLAAPVAVPELAASLDYAAGWFGKEEAFQLEVSELLPLFAEVAGSRTRIPEQRFTRAVYLLPVALGWLVWEARRQRRPELWLVAVWAGFFALGTLVQIRFMNALSAPYAIVLAGAAVAAVRALRASIPDPRRGWAIAAVAAALVLFAAAPSGRFLYGRMAVWWEGKGATAGFAYMRGLAYRHAARWLSNHSPPTRGYLEPGLRPEYGMVVPWDVGHLVRYEGRRPQIQDNLGIYVGRESFLAAGRYFAAKTEGEAIAILDRLGVRYVMIDSLGSGHGPAVVQPMTRKLYRPGLDVAAGQSPRLSALGRHRLVFETPVRQRGVWHLMIYEVVAGARIVGRAPPGAVVEARLPVISRERDEPLLWRARVRAGPGGRYRLPVPYGNGGAGPVRAGPAYRLGCGGADAPVTVREAQVREGAEVPGPDLACPEPQGTG